MNPLEQVNGYLRSLESRLRWTALSRGAAVVALAALFTTIILVVAMNSYAFSQESLRVSRILLFLCLGLALALGLALPVTRLNRRRTARLAGSSGSRFQPAPPHVRRRPVRGVAATRWTSRVRLSLRT